jgi:hypothetical protein
MATSNHATQEPKMKFRTFILSATIATTSVVAAPVFADSKTDNAASARQLPPLTAAEKARIKRAERKEQRKAVRTERRLERQDRQQLNRGS